MVEVTESDKLAAEAALPALLASIKGEEGGHSLTQAFATHREAAAKAERDRMDAAYLEAFDVHMSLIVTNWPKIKHVPTAIALAAKTMDTMVSFQTLREPTPEMVRHLNAACDTPDADLEWVFPIIADALEKQHD